MVVNLRAEVCEVKDKEEAALALVEKFKEKARNLEKVVSVKNEEIHREVIARELIEEKFEETKLKMNKLEQDISMKDEEIKNLTETTGACRLGSHSVEFVPKNGKSAPPFFEVQYLIQESIFCKNSKRGTQNMDIASVL